jgi:hypothetical protein
MDVLTPRNRSLDERLLDVAQLLEESVARYLALTSRAQPAPSRLMELDPLERGSAQQRTASSLRKEISAPSRSLMRQL